MRTKPYKYELSKDKVSLIAFCETDNKQKFTYHIHSNELTKLEKWIKKILTQRGGGVR